MQALLIEPADLIADAIGKQLALCKVNHDRLDLNGLRDLVGGHGSVDIAHDAIIIGDVGDTEACVAMLRARNVTAAIICLIEQASPLSRAVSSGLNQLKHPLGLLDACCSGISSAKPYRVARLDQPAPRS